LGGEEAPPDQPHPLGPRDIIEVLAPWSRTIITAVIVVVIGVGAYLLGAARERLTILDSPRAETGVLWYCDGRLQGVVRLPPGAATVVIGDSELETVIGQEGVLAMELGERSTGDRVRVERGELSASLPVLDCAARPERR
jgi:hypothetical protein